MNEIVLIEELAARAWPPATLAELDGWRLRFTGGVTRRANSVLAPAHGGTIPLEEKIRHVEDAYARLGLPPRYQLCPASQPPGLDMRLAELGYAVDASCIVMTAPLPLATGVASGPRVAISDENDPAWASAWWTIDRGQATPPPVLGILRGSRGAAANASIESDGRIVAVGRGCAERGWLGIFAMATRPDQRGRGHARAVLDALGAWAAAAGATRAYLQVEARNEPAIRLYGAVGFREAYRYHYRELAPG